jgi:putative transposase
MSFYTQAHSLPNRFRLVLASFLQRPGLPFADALSEDAIQKAFDEEDAGFAEDEDAVYTPAITLWAFLSQVLFKDEHRSCVAAVARVVVLLVALERGPCSSNTGAYCRARAKLSEEVIRQITINVGEGCEDKLDEQWLWHGRHVRLIDGTTVSMPDTPENQEAYPQNTQQQPGLGFPIARVVVALSLASGMLTDMAMGPYAGKETGETALLRQLLDGFEQGDVLLADRLYCSYFMIAVLQELGVDFVARVHQRRSISF